jgi:serine/threonine protein kinase
MQIAARLRTAAARGSAPALLDVFAERDRHFLVFELPAGEQLSEIMRRTTDVAEEDIIHLGLSMLEAAAPLGGAGVQLVHGNLCPDAIIVQPNGTLTFVGFSPTLLVREGPSRALGCAGGVRGYAAPEQLRGEADPRADLFAIAVILRQAEASATGAHSLHLSAELDDLLECALRPDHAQRIGTMEEFRQGLLALVPSRPPAGADAGSKFIAPPPKAMHTALPASVAALRAELDQPTRPPIASLWAVRAVLVAVLVLALVAVSVLYLQRSRASGPTARAYPAVALTTPLDT